MVKAELNKRSPLRILEKSTHGGVKAGDLGIIASPHGVGKTACLVHLSTDQLFQGKHVIHVSFADRTDHIVTWYETIFVEIAKEKHLDSASEIHDELIKNRVIMNFNQSGVNVAQLERSLKSLVADGHFNAELVVIDGLNFANIDSTFLRGLRNVAASLKVAIWITADADTALIDKRGVPQSLAGFLDEITVLITLKTHQDHIALKVVKDRDQYSNEDLHLKLDSKTLLISQGD